MSYFFGNKIQTAVSHPALRATQSYPTLDFSNVYAYRRSNGECVYRAYAILLNEFSNRPFWNIRLQPQAISGA